jgi:hypothetical protein
MAYDYYWTGYEFTMDMEALNNLGITNVIYNFPLTKTFEYMVLESQALSNISHVTF